ncbi:MAG: hypothetical protein H7Y04_06585 [Verrucomicrobia bacterium]|nr:hypothetical protein [Cytophagales bacterium]
MKKTVLIVLIFLFACKSKVEKIKPVVASISESIYASGIIKSKNQYEAFVTVNGNIDQIFVPFGVLEQQTNYPAITPIVNLLRWHCFV